MNTNNSHIIVSELGDFNDERLNRTANTLFQKVMDKKNLIIKHIADNRKEEVKFDRFLWNDKVSTKEMIDKSAQKVSLLAENAEHVIVIQDTTELNYDHRRDEIKELGFVNDNRSIGIFAHPAIAVDSKDNFVLGVAALKLWFYEPEHLKLTYHQRDRLPTELKTSYRWIQTAIEAKKSLSGAKMVTFISDRESDIYDLFCEVPDKKTHVLIRAKQQRLVISPKNYTMTLKRYIESLSCVGRIKITLSKQARNNNNKKKSVAEKFGDKTNGRESKETILKVYFGKIQLKKSKRSRPTNPKTVEVYVVYAIETGVDVESEERISWTLLTTHPVNNFEDAVAVINLYKKRWFVEQYFRLAKKGGMRLEEIESVKGDVIKKLITIGFIVTIQILQLTLCRDGVINRPATTLFNSQEICVLRALNKKYEGNTKKQKNPHTPETVAWCHWILARIGGWKGYLKSEGPAGPYTLRAGIEQFQQLVKGVLLAKDLCIS